MHINCFILELEWEYWPQNDNKVGMSSPWDVIVAFICIKSSLFGTWAFDCLTPDHFVHWVVGQPYIHKSNQTPEKKEEEKKNNKMVWGLLQTKLDSEKKNPILFPTGLLGAKMS